MKILWIDLNCSYAHSSLALPALHAQIAENTSIEWVIVSATINENVGSIVDDAISLILLLRQLGCSITNNYYISHQD